MFVILLALCVVCHAADYQSGMQEEEYQLQFVKWMNTFGKSYTSNDFFSRYRIFRDNLDIIMEHNAGNHTFTLGTNEFSDLTTQEWSQQMFGSSPSSTPDPLDAPTEPVQDGLVNLTSGSLDWVSKGAVTGVKNQHPCSSCWAFSTVAGIEGQLGIHKSLVSLSEQQLLNCVSDRVCAHGGDISQALDYVKSKGICSESKYSWTGKDSSCKASSYSKVTYVSGKTHLTSEDQLMSYIGKGPISISVGTNDAFHHYSGGVFDHSSGCATRGHDVTLVGYGESSGTKYWKVKNSWGTSWGEKGYIRMKRGVKMCGIGHKGYLPQL